MTRLKTPTCPKCKGATYVLTNQSGHVQAKVCDCFQCELCGGEGRIFSQNETGQSFLADCSCLVLKKRLRLLSDAGIPGKFIHADFSTYETEHGIHISQKKAKERTQNFIKDFRASKRTFNSGLVLMGGPGLGKTHLAVSLIKTLILEDGIDCRFVDFFQLLSEIRHGYSQDLSEQDLIMPYLRARVLVIDEMGKGRNNEWERTVLDQFISSRYNAANKITIFTSNFPKDVQGRKDARLVDPAEPLDRETLQNKVGDRTFSRLVEMCDFVIMQGKDIRVHSKPR